MTEWIYGRNAVRETLRAGRRRAQKLRLAEDVKREARLDEIVSLAEKGGIAVERAKRKELDKLAKGHQGVALQASDYPYSDLSEILRHASERGEAPFLLLLDALKDPQNLGTLLRTAEAVGVHGVMLPARRTATVTPAVVNASSGASEHLRIGQQNLAQAITVLKEEGLWVLGLEGGAEAEPIERVDLSGPLALVVGSEAEGMRKLVRDSCDVLMGLEMRGAVESLNAAVAGSVALYLARQARSQAS